jgi:hypothetical protein
MTAEYFTHERVTMYVCLFVMVAHSALLTWTEKSMMRDTTPRRLDAMQRKLELIYAMFQPQPPSGTITAEQAERWRSIARGFSAYGPSVPGGEPARPAMASTQDLDWNRSPAATQVAVPRESQIEQAMPEATRKLSKALIDAVAEQGGTLSASEARQQALDMLGEAGI